MLDGKDALIAQQSHECAEAMKHVETQHHLQMNARNEIEQYVEGAQFGNTEIEALTRSRDALSSEVSRIRSDNEHYQKEFHKI